MSRPRPIGVASLIGLEVRPFDEFVRHASELGFDAVSANVGPSFPAIPGADFAGHIDVERLDAGAARRVRELMEDHAIDLTALAPMLNLLTADLDERARRRAYFESTLRAAADLDVELVITFAGSVSGMYLWGMPGQPDLQTGDELEENLDVFAEVFTPLARMAEELGIRIAFETAGRGGGEGNLAHAPALWERLFERVPSHALGLSFDPSHLVWLHVPDAPALIREFRVRIFHVEGKDTELYPNRLAREGIWGSRWWRYRLPGLGQVNWSEILSALDEVGYEGPVTLENEDPTYFGLEHAAWAADHLRRCAPFGGAA